jgi:uncharacterized radical SAM superfamily protein
LEFVYPLKTRAVSVTGDRCALSCAHCNRHYLGHMTPITGFKPEDDTRSILISGGCNDSGEVPLLDFATDIIRLRKHYRTVVHTGLFPPQKAEML